MIPWAAGERQMFPKHTNRTRFKKNPPGKPLVPMERILSISTDRTMQANRAVCEDRVKSSKFPSFLDRLQ
jgi:hypothetical protein